MCKKRCIDCVHHRTLMYRYTADGLVCLEFGTLTDIRDLTAEVEIEDEEDVDYCPMYEESDTL